MSTLPNRIVPVHPDSDPDRQFASVWGPDDEAWLTDLLASRPAAEDSEEPKAAPDLAKSVIQLRAQFADVDDSFSRGVTRLLDELLDEWRSLCATTWESFFERREINRQSKLALERLAGRSAAIDELKKDLGWMLSDELQLFSGSVVANIQRSLSDRIGGKR
jgi:hypothetical protein